MAPRIFIIGLLAIFLAGCGAYSGLSQPVQSAFIRGDYLPDLLHNLILITTQGGDL